MFSALSGILVAFVREVLWCSGCFGGVGSALRWCWVRLVCVVGIIKQSLQDIWIWVKR